MEKNSRTYIKFGLVASLLAILLGASVFNSFAGGNPVRKAEQRALFSTNKVYLLSGAEPSRQTFSIEGVERAALVFPNSAPLEKNGAPLVFVFHGHGGNSQVVARKFQIQTQWPEAVVIYPQGLPAPGKFDPEGQKSGWQKKAGDLGDRDLKFFDAMLAWAQKQFKIDTHRIYVAGHSNGGAMTYVLWSARSHLIAAFAPCAAGFGRDVLSAKPKPAILLAGEQDQVVPFENQKRSMDFVLRLNQCDMKGTARGQELTFYKSKVGADVLAYIYPGAHALPQNSGAVIVKFFKEYSLK
jgi:polyhydroxybutyrate depolymerase